MDRNIVIREGVFSDNEDLLRLTALTPMMSKIAIRIDRKPDFFSLLKLRGASFVMVAESAGKIVGSLSISRNTAFINEQQELINYIGDFKVLPEFQKSTVAIRLTKAVFQKLEQWDADIVFCNTPFGNKAVAPFFKGRAWIPPAECLGVFDVMQMIPRPLIWKKSNYLVKEDMVSSDIIAFFNDFSKHYQMGTVHSKVLFDDGKLLTASLNGDLSAAIFLSDVVSSKQNSLIRLPFYLNCAAAFIRLFGLVFPIVKAHKVGEPVRILYVKSFSCKPDCEDALKDLVNKARNMAFKEKYHFLNIGVHSKDPMRKVFSSCLHFNFKTQGYVWSMKGDTQKLRAVLDGVVSEDYSVV